MTTHSTLRNEDYDDLLVRAREAYVECGFIKFIGEQVAYERQNNIRRPGRFDLQDVPMARLPDVIRTMENFNHLISESGVEPVFHRELTTITLVQFLWRIERIGVNEAFLPDNNTMEEHSAFIESIRKIYS